MTVLHDLLLSMALTLGFAVGVLLAAVCWKRGKTRRERHAAPRE